MTLEECVQLEFPFTLRGRMQKYAIDQNVFLRSTYKVYLKHLHANSLNPQSFELFEQSQGLIYMKHFRDKYGTLYFPNGEVYH